MKQQLLLACILLCLAIPVFSQKEPNRVNISVGPSWHGTGDLHGFAVGLQHEHDFNRRLGIANGLTTTIHYGRDKGLNYLYPGTSPENRLMRFTTAGIQLNSLGQYHFLAAKNNRLTLHAGVVVRFESSSYPSVYTYTQEQPELQEPYYVIYAYDNPNSFRVGYNVGLTFRTRVAPLYFAGVRAAFQNDTNGDAITSISIVFERVLSRPDKKK